MYNNSFLYNSNEAKAQEENTGGELLLFKEEAKLDRLAFSRDRSNKYLRSSGILAKARSLPLMGRSMNSFSYAADTSI